MILIIGAEQVRMLDPTRVKKLKAAYEKATSLLPNLDHPWTTWPATLIALGLGYELGALPRNQKRT